MNPHGGNKMQIELAEQTGTVQKGIVSPVSLRHQPDELLVAESLDGSSNAFGALFERYERKMFQVAMRVLRHHEDAEDAVQQAFKSAFVHLTSFQGQSRFSTWLTRITVNEALMLLRKRRPGHISLDGNASVQGEEVALEIEDRAATPEERCGEQELHGVLNEAIGELKPTYRDVVQLHEIEELTTGKTAEVLGLTGGTVKTRVFRARHALRRKLTERLGISPRQAAPSFFLESRNTRGSARQTGLFASAI
jgi:RNA polymerase sigma-70 factor (ECF subfamily)